jgi:hypothetical protein
MTEERKYDPDRMNIDDVDPDDLKARFEWLDHPNTQAFHEDLGRAFRNEPPEVQLAELRPYLDDLLKQRDEAAALPPSPDPTVRIATEELVAGIEQAIEAARARIAELEQQS